MSWESQPDQEEGGLCGCLPRYGLHSQQSLVFQHREPPVSSRPTAPPQIGRKPSPKTPWMLRRSRPGLPPKVAGCRARGVIIAHEFLDLLAYIPQAIRVLEVVLHAGHLFSGQTEVAIRAFGVPPQVPTWAVPGRDRARAALAISKGALKRRAAQDGLRSGRRRSNRSRLSLALFVFHHY